MNNSTRPTFLLLLGAGFSRNWGGWLATEVFDFLIGVPVISANPVYRRLLWRHHEGGGFEDALSEIQADFARNPSENAAALHDFQSAISEMFEAMNHRLLRIPLERSPGHGHTRLLLNKFDAIFTLNQDMLLEASYFQSASQPAGKTRGGFPRPWGGVQLPGIVQRSPGDSDLVHWVRGEWGPDDAATFDLAPDLQPVFKLHGSSNWTEKGRPLMVLGGAKVSTIRQFPVLSNYAARFDEYLARPNTRLMVIGYGFRDEHVNQALRRVSERSDFEMFVVDPLGSDLARSTNSLRRPGLAGASSNVAEQIFEQCLIGATRRRLTDVLDLSDRTEYDKLERFFNLPWR